MPLVLNPSEKQIVLERADELEQDNADIDIRLVELAVEITALTPVEDLNTKIYEFFDGLIEDYDTERRAVDGKFPENPVTAASIDQAARATGLLFPETHTELVPLRVVDLDGGAGFDPNNELLGIADEVDAIDLLLGVPFVMRSGGPEDLAMQDALAVERDALDRQLLALAANENYGVGSAPHTAAQSAFDQVDAFLASPDLTDAGLNTRRVQAIARQQFLENTRLPTVDTELTPLYDERFAWLDARVNLAFGTRTLLFALQDEADQLTEQKPRNDFLRGRYTDLAT